MELSVAERGHQSSDGAITGERTDIFFGKRLVHSIVFLTIGYGLMLGDVFWLALVAYWSAMLSIHIGWRPTAAIPIVVGGAIILSHLAGHKIYGAPTLCDSRPVFENPITLDHLEAPNVLVATDGSRHEMKDFRFREDVLALPPTQQRGKFNYSSEPFRFAVADTPSGYAGEWHHRYGCGNTWFPKFFPEALPSHSAMDLAFFVSRISEPTTP